VGPHPLRFAAVLALVATLGLPAAAPAECASAPDPALAALQITMRARMLYRGPVTGLADPRTEVAVRTLQHRLGVVSDGVLGRQTLSRLAPAGPGASVLGRRLLTIGDRGYDVALLRVELALHGFPSGRFTSVYTPRTARAVLRFQRWARLPQTAMAGPLTARALKAPPPVSPVRLAWPVASAVTSGYGLRGARFHAGLDLVAPYGTPVGAAGAGEVVWAGWREGGWGNAVMIAHGRGVRTLVAHLSRVDVKVGQWVRTGDRVGLSGSTGDSTGPHVHFEVRLRGAYVDPATALR
jgi:murein DD-endopeptidase MepM/ murein hydrolase activator NlpD